MSRCFVYLLLASSLFMTSTAFDWNVLNPFHWIIKWLSPEETTTNSTIKYSINETTLPTIANLTTGSPGKVVTSNNGGKPISFNNVTAMPAGMANKTQTETEPSNMSTAGTLVNISELATQQANTDIFGKPKATLKVFNATTKDKSRVPFRITDKTNNITDNSTAKSTNISIKEGIVRPPLVSDKNTNMSINHPGNKANNSLINPLKTGSIPAESPVSPIASNATLSNNNNHQDIPNDSPRPASNDSLLKHPQVPTPNNKDLLNQKVTGKDVTAKLPPKDNQKVIKNTPESLPEIMDNLNKNPATQSSKDSQKLAKKKPASPPEIMDNLYKIPAAIPTSGIGQNLTKNMPESPKIIDNLQETPAAKQSLEDSQKLTKNMPESPPDLHKNPSSKQSPEDSQTLTKNMPDSSSKVTDNLPKNRESETKENTMDIPKNSDETPRVLEKTSHNAKLATA